MSRRSDLVCSFVVISGVVLFLYGANYYENIVGWSGVFLFVGGILAWVIIYVYEKLIKETPVQNP